MKNENKGIIALVSTSLLFSLFGVFASILSKSLTAFQVIFFISILKLLFLLVLIGVKKVKITFSKSMLPRLLSFAIVSALPLLFFNLAVSQEKIGLVLVAQNSVTLFISFLISIYFLKEKAGIKEFGLITIIVLGIATIYLPEINGKFLGIIFASIVGILNVISNLLRKNLGGDMHPFALSMYQSIFGVIIASILIFSSQQNIKLSFSVSEIGVLVLYALMNVTTTILLIVGFSKTRFNFGNIILTLEIPLGIMVGFLILGQKIESYQFTGGLIVTIAIILIRVLSFERESTKKIELIRI